MNRKTENLLIYVLVSSAFIISLYTFVITPFTGDIFVLFAGSHQADMLGGNIITNPLMQCDLKGALYRLALYIIYRCVNPYVNLIGTGTNFWITVNAFFCACVIALMTFSVIIANGIKEGRKNFLVILALCTGIFASLPQNHIQAEMICTVKLIFAFSLYINAQRTKTFFRAKCFLSGFLAAEIVFYKSIFALMAVPFVAGVYLYNRKNNYTLSFRQFMFIFSGGLAAVIIWMAVILYVNPNEIQNMLDAAVYQPPIFSGTRTIFNSLFIFMKSSAFTLLTVPAILMGIVYGVVNFLNNIR